MFSAQRPAQERAGVSREKSRPDNGQDVASQIRVARCQWVYLGSDQADRPVTTSNFLRSELTSWGALSSKERCSRSEMIRARAASAAVMALSEKYWRCSCRH